MGLSNEIAEYGAEETIGECVFGTLTNIRTSEKISLEESPTSLGRHEANVIRLRGFSISRFHTEIGVTPDGIPYIEDMGSTYGTYVGGHKIDGRVKLDDQASIVLGVSSGFPNGEYSFTFQAVKEALQEAPKDSTNPNIRKSITAGHAKADHNRKDILILHLAGIFRRNECDALSEKIIDILRDTPKNVILELSGVEYMNSYSLGMLMKLSQDIERLGQKLALASAGGLVQKLFRTVGLDQKLDIFHTTDEAAAGLTK